MLTVAVVVAAAASATTTAAASASASATTSAVATAPAATTSPAFTRPRFVDDQGAAEKLLAVEGGDGFFGFRIVTKFRETETAGLTGKAVLQESE